MLILSNLGSTKESNKIDRYQLKQPRTVLKARPAEFENDQLLIKN